MPKMTPPFVRLLQLNMMRKNREYGLSGTLTSASSQETHRPENLKSHMEWKYPIGQIVRPPGTRLHSTCLAISSEGANRISLRNVLCFLFSRAPGDGQRPAIQRALPGKKPRIFPSYYRRTILTTHCDFPPLNNFSRLYL
jgi:hypothetical protein